ncbi:hypothetical protein AK830_g10773 [Neonectria ditissima]|uniref:Uncharacterized protein n=1 Tax=Neonectria ditissima TaxID=78410 RepID=A0A0P7ASN7_9HYPO|nr:hypothetical protein AK830_g10773 [Neonectria ditissima]
MPATQEVAQPIRGGEPHALARWADAWRAIHQARHPQTADARFDVVKSLPEIFGNKKNVSPFRAFHHSPTKCPSRAAFSHILEERDLELEAPTAEEMDDT